MLFSRCGCGGRFFAAFDQGLGLHAQRGNGLLDFPGVGMGMAHPEDTIDQVEFQLFDACQLAQFVLDQGLLGRAVHGLDAEAAQARIATGRFTQLHQRGCGIVGAAAVGMLGMVMAGVIVGVFTRGMADRLVHGFILKCPVAK
ncbi:hypothetical protein D3C80_645320 [compost metagenome]